jgi:tetratricopeptide (TPR) repeat protein
LPSPADLLPAAVDRPAAGKRAGGADPAAAFRYAAFISYSHRDKAEAAWLHRALERFRVPRRLVGQETPFGRVPERLAPVFRDRDELPASGDLGAELTAALAGSRALVVIASPAAAASRWVNEEILAYKRMHGASRVLALVVDGEANARDPALEALPPALRFHLDHDGALSDRPAEPIAADLRREADGRRLAFLKIAAGLTGLTLDSLVQREAQRRARRMTVIASAAVAGMALTSGLAFYANSQRVEAERQRHIAERESATARAAADYLVGTFELVNPATENPRTISAFEILSRSADRAALELKGEPEVQVRITEALARAYMNLGLYDESERLLVRSRLAMARAGTEGAFAYATLGETYLRQGNTGRARVAVGRALAMADAEIRNGNPAGELARARVLLATARLDRADGKSQDALATLDAALVAFRASGLSRPLDEARMLHNKGQILGELGDLDAANAALAEADRIYVAELGPRHRLVGEIRYDEAINAHVEEKYDLALARIEDSRRILGAVLDPGNPFRAHVLALKGQVLYDRKAPLPADRARDLRESRAALDEAVAIYRQAFDKPNYVVGISQLYLGLVAGEQGDPARGLAYLDEAKANFDASYGGLHPNHGVLLVYRALVLRGSGRTGEAERECAEGMAILEKLLGTADFTTQYYRRECAGAG